MQSSAVMLFFCRTAVRSITFSPSSISSSNSESSSSNSSSRSKSASKSNSSFISGTQFKANTLERQSSINYSIDRSLGPQGVGIAEGFEVVDHALDEPFGGGGTGGDPDLFRAGHIRGIDLFFG